MGLILCPLRYGDAHHIIPRLFRKEETECAPTAAEG